MQLRPVETNCDSRAFRGTAPQLRFDREEAALRPSAGCKGEWNPRGAPLGRSDPSRR